VSSHTLAVDPGDITGWSTWDPDDPWNAKDSGQTPNWEFVYAVATATGLDEAMKSSPLFRTVVHQQDTDLIEKLEGFDHIICEDWKLYPDPQRPGHLILPAWDPCDTARVIGALDFICSYTGKRFTLQGANIKSKALALSAGESFLRPLHPNRHANDSIMHWHFYAGTQGLLHRDRSPA